MDRENYEVCMQDFGKVNVSVALTPAAATARANG